MVTYLQLGKWTSKGAEGLLSEGFKVRAETAQDRIVSMGGTCRGYWYIAEGDWHVAAIWEFDEDRPGLGVQALYQQVASGVVDDMRLIRLVDPDEVESAQAFAYRPPGAD